MKKLFAPILLVFALILLCSCADANKTSDTSATTQTSASTQATTKPHVHEYGEWETVKKPTCTEKGEQISYCGCGTSQTRELEPAHTEVIVTGYAPTESETGLSDKKYCSVCGTVLREHDILPPTGFGMFAYRINYGRQTCSIYGMGTYNSDILYIPPEIDGYPVTLIERQAFENTFDVKEVYIPSTVETIRQNAFIFCGAEKIHFSNGLKQIHLGAFQYCHNVRTITIPESVTEIQGDAFGGCNRLIEVINKSSLDIAVGSEKNGFGNSRLLAVRKDESRIVSKDGYLFYLTEDEVYMIGYEGTEKDITLPADYNGIIYKINSFAFSQNTVIENVTIPEGISYMGENAFSECHGLKSVNLPSTMTKFPDGCFSYCYNLTTVNIPNGTEAIPAGMFENCHSLTKIDLPESIISIGYGAFNECIGLTEFTLPSKVTEIPASMMRNCINLEKIIISAALKDIGNNAFDGCDKLTQIIFGGTKDQFSRVATGSRWSHQDYVYCIDGKYW